MKHQNLLVLLITIFSVITISCSNDEEDEDLMGKWYRVSDFDGLARGEATSFTIGNKGYLTGDMTAENILMTFGNTIWNLISGHKKLLFQELPAAQPQLSL